MRKILICWFEFWFGLNDKHNLKYRMPWLWVVCGVNWKIASFLFNKLLDLDAFFGLYPHASLNSASDVIVSMTSYPGRINSVWKAVDSIFYQKEKPQLICLYLSEEEFPNRRADLPQRLLGYEKLGLKILFREHNLMAHNKYYYAFREYPKKLIITIDDDFYYSTNLISNLLDIHKTYQDSICSNTLHVITFSLTQKFLPYSQWSQRHINQLPSHLNLALGYNGVLYPRFDYNKDFFDMNLIKELSLKADDLWLKANEIVNNIKVANGKYLCAGIEVGGSQVISLSKSNIVKNENDIQWGKLCEHFHISYNNFFDE